MRSGASPSARPEACAFSGVEESAPATSSYSSSIRAAMRWTAPMKASLPPPTMPSRMRAGFSSLISFLPVLVAASAGAQPSPSSLRFAASSVPPAAKSSKACSVTRMMCALTNSAPSRAPSSGCFSAHSHSTTAQPSKS